MTTTATAQVHRAARSEWTRRLAAIGLGARSVLYATLAVLVLQVAFGQDRQRTDSSGALHALAREPFGKLVLALLAAGFAVYAFWRLVEACTAHPGREHDGVIRAVDVARTIVYGGLCALAIATLLGSRSAAKGGQEQGWTARVLGWPHGRAIVAIVGVALIAGAIAIASHLVDGSWRDNIDLRRVSREMEPAIVACAYVGIAARALVIAAIGVFVVQAAWQYDPRTGVGLDGALHRLAHASHGTLVLVIVAIGLLAYAVYSVIEAALRPSAED